MKQSYAVSLLLALCFLGIAHGDLFKYTTYDVPGATDTYLYDIDNSGHLIALYSDATGDHAILDENGTVTSIMYPDPPGTTTKVTEIFGMNSETIVGHYDDTDAGTPGHQAFVYDRTTDTYAPFPIPFSPGTNTYATEISDNGMYIVGLSQPGHSYIYDGSAFTEIAFPGVSWTQVFGVNNSGDMVGYYRDGTIIDVGFIYDAATHTYTDFDLGGLPGVVRPLEINNAGDVAGIYTDGGHSRGFFYDARTDTHTWLDVPGATDTGAYGINAQDDIVGRYYDGPNSHGFIASPVPEPTSLILASIGLSIAGWRMRRKRR